MADTEDKRPFQADPLWVTGTVETNGTGGDETTESVSPAAARFRAEALAFAAENPDDDSVILPGDDGDLDDDEAKRRLSKAAKEAKNLVGDLDKDGRGVDDDVKDQVLSAEKATAEANGGEATPTEAKVNPNATKTDETSVTKAEVNELKESAKPGPKARNTSNK